MINKISVFDFDQTLFNSPQKPEGWKGGWWGKDHSLLPPFLPRDLKEARHLLNEKVVTEYLKSKACKNTHTVMMTGRHWGLHKHVMNIMHAFDLCETVNVREDSDHYIFISGGNTLEGKLARITELFKKFDQVDFIEMWEDRPEHIKVFREYDKILRKIRDFRGIVVHEPPDWI